jgi:hypothetical protein
MASPSLTGHARERLASAGISPAASPRVAPGVQQPESLVMSGWLVDVLLNKIFWFHVDGSLSTSLLYAPLSSPAPTGPLPPLPSQQGLVPYVNLHDAKVDFVFLHKRPVLRILAADRSVWYLSSAQPEASAPLLSPGGSVIERDPTPAIPSDLLQWQIVLVFIMARVKLEEAHLPTGRRDNAGTRRPPSRQGDDHASLPASLRSTDEHLGRSDTPPIVPPRQPNLSRLGRERGALKPTPSLHDDESSVSVEAALPATCNAMRKIQMYATPRRMYLIGEVLEDPSLLHEMSGENTSIPGKTLQYRVIEFDRTVARPASLREIMHEHTATYDAHTINTVIVGIYSSVGLPVPSELASTFPSSGTGPSSTPSVPTPTVSSAATALPKPSPPASRKPSPAAALGVFGSLFGKTAPPAAEPTAEAESLLTLDVVALLGAIQFTKGYHLVVVTRRQKVGTIGNHSIFAVRETELVPIYSEANASVGQKTVFQRFQENFVASDPAAVLEGRYQSLFLHVDLSKDCFFSYSYNLTRPLQQQMQIRVFVAGARSAALDNMTPAQAGAETQHFSDGEIPGNDRQWNYHIAAELWGAGASRGWCPLLIHGYFNQVTTSIFGRPLVMTLVSRRSRHFAGARFLKRGLNDDGFVANDVETEQIADDTQGHFASFVQMRGSIPLYWMQRTNLTVPKPPIILHQRDVECVATKRHFADMFARYGAPTCVINLVKKKEKHPREKIIGTEFGHAVFAVNRQLPPPLRVQYLSIDYSALVKSKRHNILAVLRDVARWTSSNTGFFCSTVRTESMNHRRHHRHKHASAGQADHLANEHLHIVDPQSLAAPESPHRRAALPQGNTDQQGAVLEHLAPADSVLPDMSVSGAAYRQHFDSDDIVVPGRIAAQTKGGANALAGSKVEDYQYRGNNPFASRKESGVATNEVIGPKAVTVYAGTLPIVSRVPTGDITIMYKDIRAPHSPSSGAAELDYELALRGVVGPMGEARYQSAQHGQSLHYHSDSLTTAKLALGGMVRGGLPYFASFCEISKFDVVAVPVTAPAPTLATSMQNDSAHNPKAAHNIAMSPLSGRRTAAQAVTGYGNFTKVSKDQASGPVSGNSGGNAIRRGMPHRRWRLANPPVSNATTRLLAQMIALEQNELTNDMEAVEVQTSDGDSSSNDDNEEGPTDLAQFVSTPISRRARAPTHASEFLGAEALFGVRTAATPADPGKPEMRVRAQTLLPTAVRAHKSRQSKPSARKNTVQVMRSMDTEHRQESFLHCRDPNEAAKSAGITRSVVCSSTQQDSAQAGLDGNTKGGLAVRLREYESAGAGTISMGGGNSYTYVNLQGTTHGFHNEKQHVLPSRDSVLRVVDDALGQMDARDSHVRAQALDNGVVSFGMPSALTLPRIGLMLQSGVPRTNCVDCMDRTNVAQVCVGVYMFSLQLHALGLTDSDNLDPNGMIVKQLMAMYETMGDSIAIQYGGSEANKKVTTAEHAEGVRVADEMDVESGEAAATAKANDERGGWNLFGSSTSSLPATRISRLGGHSATEFLSSLQRYYANSFTDSIKQAAMNLFLGVFKPLEHTEPLWELENDQYLHNSSLTLPQPPLEAEWWQAPLQKYMRNGFPQTTVFASVQDMRCLRHGAMVLSAATQRPAPLLRAPALFPRRDLSLLGSVPVARMQFDSGKPSVFEELLSRAYLHPHQAAVPQPYKQRHIPTILQVEDGNVARTPGQEGTPTPTEPQTNVLVQPLMRKPLLPAIKQEAATLPLKAEPAPPTRPGKVPIAN